jgi:tripartite-type tricarboxylate transporter receptor subunit TctC
MIRRRDLAAGAAAAALLPGAARAQERWPTSPIRWMIGYAAGGASDIFARMIAAHMSQAFGQPVVVENRPSAGAIVATEAVVRSPADGQTILHVDNGVVVYNPAFYSRLPFDPDRDLAPVGGIGRFSFFLVVRADSPFRTAQDLIAAARTRQLNCGIPVVGAPHHMAVALFMRRAGFEMQTIAYRGSPPMVQALLSGEVDCAAVDANATVPNVQAGRARALVCWSAERARALPDVPTAAEVGVPNCVADGWMGVCVPTGTPAARIARLNEVLNTALAAEDVQRQMTLSGGATLTMTPAQFGDFIRAESALWRPLIREMGIRMD